MTTGEVGRNSEAEALATLVKKGYQVSIPFGAIARYDFVLDDGEILHRVQVKTGRLADGTIKFNACSVNGNTKESRKYDESECDTFAVWCPELSKLYLVPLSEQLGWKPYLRIDPPKNGQTKGVRMADKFEV